MRFDEVVLKGWKSIVCVCGMYSNNDFFLGGVVKFYYFFVIAFSLTFLLSILSFIL